MKQEKGESQYSVNAVIALVILLVVVFSWGFLAGSYGGAHAEKLSERIEAGEAPPRRVRLLSPVRFFRNAAQQLPNFVAVVSWNLKNRIWLPLLELAVFIAVIYGAVVMKRLDRELQQPYKVKHRKR